MSYQKRRTPIGNRAQISNPTLTGTSASGFFFLSNHWAGLSKHNPRHSYPQRQWQIWTHLQIFRSYDQGRIQSSAYIKSISSSVAEDWRKTDSQEAVYDSFIRYSDDRAWSLRRRSCSTHPCRSRISGWNKCQYFLRTWLVRKGCYLLRWIPQQQSQQDVAATFCLKYTFETFRCKQSNFFSKLLY